MFMALLALCLGGDPLSTARWSVESNKQTFADATLESMAANGSLRIRTDAEPNAITRVVELRQMSATLPPILTRNFVCLNNGDRIPLDAEAPALLENSRLFVWPATSLPSLSAKGASLYVPNIAMVFWSLPDGVEDAERYFATVEKEPRKRDVVFLQNGDRLEGTVTTLSGKEGCIAMVDNRKVHTPWSKLAGIAWNTDRQSRLKTKNAYWRAVLEGGARVNLLEATFDAKTRRWTGVTQWSAKLDLPETSVLALDRRGADAIDLADLTPTRYEPRPYLGVAWPFANNASVSGASLRLSGNTYEHGIGVHAACRVEYKLDGKYQRLLGSVGIREGARLGRAKVAIEVDGKRAELNEGKELTSQTPPILIQLDVSGARTLTLIVDAGSFGDVQAHVDFAKARLIKKE